MALSEEDERFLNEVIAENEAMKAAGVQPQMPMSPMWGAQNKPNLVEWQLDFKSELADIARLLRCDVFVFNQRTQRNEWQTNPRKEYVFLNDLGVNDVLREIRMILNKNTVLSNYREEQISERLRQLGHELRALLYTNSEMYDLNNEYKWNNYAIMIITVLSMVESAYRRAINGEERRDLNQARVVQQTEQPMMMGNMGSLSSMMQPKKKVHWYNPLTWGR